MALWPGLKLVIIVLVLQHELKRSGIFAMHLATLPLHIRSPWSLLKSRYAGLSQNYCTVFFTDHKDVHVIKWSFMTLNYSWKSNRSLLCVVQDTLKAPPAENKTMKRATLIGILTTTIFYMSVGCVGYAAFGDAAPGNLLTGFGFYNPYWLVDFANACIVVHLVGAYQVFIGAFHHFSSSLVSLLLQYYIPEPGNKILSKFC